MKIFLPKLFTSYIYFYNCYCRMSYGATFKVKIAATASHSPNGDQKRLDVALRSGVKSRRSGRHAIVEAQHSHEGLRFSCAG
jgi:hypothetical protein